MEVCAKHDVLVILPNKTFDFNDSNDRLMFKLEAEFAAKDNELRTRLLSEARLRKSMRGEYDGRILSVGIIVDRDKTSKTYGHYIPYEPHAKVVRWLYKRYRELGGRFNLLASEVAKMDVVFPDFEPWVSKLDKARLRLEKVPGGYHMSRDGPFSLLTAVEYAGYWKVHEAIVSGDDWEYAWRRLSWTTLTGEKNVERVVPHNSWINESKPVVTMVV
jgi:hypothetical protein